MSKHNRRSKNKKVMDAKTRVLGVLYNYNVSTSNAAEMVDHLINAVRQGDAEENKDEVFDYIEKDEIRKIVFEALKETQKTENVVIPKEN